MSRFNYFYSAASNNHFQSGSICSNNSEKSDRFGDAKVMPPQFLFSPTNSGTLKSLHHSSYSNMGKTGQAGHIKCFT